MTKKLLVDLSADTVKPKLVDMTAEEATQAEADAAAGAASGAAVAALTANESTLRDRADQAIATLENAWSNWGTLSAANKDAALKLSVRVTIALARLVLRKLDSQGV